MLYRFRFDTALRGEIGHLLKRFDVLRGGSQDTPNNRLR